MFRNICTRRWATRVRAVAADGSVSYLAGSGEGESVQFLSEEWLEALTAEAVGLPTAAGCSVSVRLEISGAPYGKGSLSVRLEDGQLAEVARGRPVAEDCVVSCSYDDALAICEGRLDPAVAYMRGDLKLDGTYERVLFGLRPMLQGAGKPALLELRRKLFASTLSNTLST